jgi:putative mRNA 3-end processing factor
MVKIYWSDGLVISDGHEKMTFDPRRTIEGCVTFITHAHGDHVSGFLNPGEKCSTKQTADLYRAGNRRKPEDHKFLQYGETLKLDTCRVQLLNAGHILGSAQFKIETPEGVIVYTGDMNLQETLLTAPAEIEDAEVLIIESTYGEPSYVFPRREYTYADIAKWISQTLETGRTPFFRVSPVGKAQEIIAITNQLTYADVVVHPKVSCFSEVYVRNGAKLRYHDAKSEEGEEILARGEAVLVYPQNEEAAPQGEVSQAVATGWALRFKRWDVDKAFPLSLHADFRQLLSYVEAARPRIVYTCHGFDDRLATIIRKRCRIEAYPIKNLSRESLTDYLFS